MHDAELISLALILGAAVASQLVAAWIRIPSIVLLLISGFTLGVTDLIDPDELLGEELLVALVSVSIGVILFEGGLTLDLRELRGSVSRVVLLLVSVGVVLTWLAGAVGAYVVFEMSWEIALVLGAVLVVSGPTVVLPILRQVRPRGQVAFILRWEGILVDPIGVILAVLVFQAVVAGREPTNLEIIQRYGINLGIGVGVGIAGAAFLLLILRRARLRSEQEVAFTLATVVVAFVVADVLAPEAGLVSATLMGVLLANQRLPITGVGNRLPGPLRRLVPARLRRARHIGWGRPVEVRHILSFKEAVGLLLTGILFVLLAARVDAGELGSLAARAVPFVLILIVIRFVAVAIATLPTRMSMAERLFMSWMAPRGIVAASTASVFALSFVELAEEDPDLAFTGAEDIATITFLVIVATVVLYGVSAGPLARRLGLTVSGAPRVLIVGAHAWGRRLASALAGQKIPVTVWAAQPGSGRLAAAEGLDVFSEDLLSADAFSHPRLNEIGLAIVLTDNAEFNRLAVAHLREFVLRGDIYQVRTARGGEGGGTPAFGDTATSSNLRAWFDAGGRIEALPITEGIWEPRTDDVPMLLVRPGRSVRVLTDRKAIRATPPGTTVSRPGTADMTGVDRGGERSRLRRFLERIGLLRRRPASARGDGSSPVVIAMVGAQTTDPESISFTA